MNLSQKIIIAWHKYHYKKYRYMEAGCINEKIRKDLKEKKEYHYKRYASRLTGSSFT